MSRPKLTEKQLRIALVKCSTRLRDLSSRCEVSATGMRTILPPHHAELNEVIVHAVITLVPAIPNAVYFRTMISRTYAVGRDRATGAPTVESVCAIQAMVDTALAGMSATGDAG